MGSLTIRQIRIARMVRAGYTNKEIADALGTTENRVKNLLRDIFDECGVWTRLELAIHVYNFDTNPSCSPSVTTSL